MISRIGAWIALAITIYAAVLIFFCTRARAVEPDCRTQLNSCLLWSCPRWHPDPVMAGGQWIRQELAFRQCRLACYDAFAACSRTAQETDNE
jgi:hypothetical protein